MTDEKFTDRVGTPQRLTELRGSGGGKTAPAAGEPMPAESEAPHEAFKVLSADRQQKVMLELRFQTGNARALAYSYLVSIDFDPSTKIRLDFSGYEVRIAGRNLEPLFAGLVAQRVAIVQEMDELHAEASLDARATVVTGIEVVTLD